MPKTKTSAKKKVSVTKTPSQETMESVKTITIPQVGDVDILYKNEKLGYTFQYNGKNYGTAVTPESKEVGDIAAACLLLIINAQETFKELEKNAGK